MATHPGRQNALEQHRDKAGDRLASAARAPRGLHGRLLRRCGAAGGCGTLGRRLCPARRVSRALEAGELDVLFAVDMFNEGVDVPAIDTVMMLRPTESANPLAAAVRTRSARWKARST